MIAPVGLKSGPYSFSTIPYPWPSGCCLGLPGRAALLGQKAGEAGVGQREGRQAAAGAGRRGEGGGRGARGAAGVGAGGGGAGAALAGAAPAERKGGGGYGSVGGAVPREPSREVAAETGERGIPMSPAKAS